MNNLTTTQETKLVSEFRIIKNQILISENQKLTKTEKLIKILTLAKQSEFFRDCLSLVDFHSDNIFHNNLPKNSSGSYFTALNDIDGLLEEMGIENSSQVQDLFKYTDIYTNINA